MFKTKEEIIKEYSKAILLVFSTIGVCGLDLMGIVGIGEAIPYAVILDCSYYLWG